MVGREAIHLLVETTAVVAEKTIAANLTMRKSAIVVHHGEENASNQNSGMLRVLSVLIHAVAVVEEKPAGDDG